MAQPDVTTRPDDDTPWAAWKTRLTAARRRRDDLVPEWQKNVTARRGKPSETSNASAPVSVNQDWPLTKAKIAQLYSQTPEVRLSPRYPELRDAVPIFGRELNDTIADAGVGPTVEEVLADVVNAAGIGAALVYYESRTEDRVDPTTGQPVPVPVDVRHCVDRISPSDLLVPSDFTSSDYDKARWLGHDGRSTWAQGVRMFGLTEDQKERVLGADRRVGGVATSLNQDTAKFRDTDVVNFTELFYWRHYYHEEETSFHAIQRVVFVEGLDEPVVNEPYQGQQRGESGVLGVVRLPIRVLTLTYISDDSLPPSDSSIGRFGVSELEASRDAMVQQRRHSIPIRWFDANRVSPSTRSLLEKGTFQGFIPTNGPGDRAVGEVSRATFPQERYEFDRVIKGELTEQWQVGTNQAGAFATGERSASEARIVQQNFQTRVGQERDKVTRFVLGIAEVLAGHLALFGTFALPDNLGIQRAQLATGFTYGVRVDSTVRQDAQQRIEQLERAINFLAQSPFANPKPLLEEYAQLNDLPAGTIVDPQPKPPEPIKVSVSKAEDINDPMFLALLMRTQQAPTPDEVAAAERLLEQLRAMGMSLLPAAVPGGTDAANAAPERALIARPEWEAAPRLDRRDEDGGA
jgi:hypothetical protein